MHSSWLVVQAYSFWSLNLPFIQVIKFFTDRRSPWCPRGQTAIGRPHDWGWPVSCGGVVTPASLGGLNSWSRLGCKNVETSANTCTYFIFINLINRHLILKAIVSLLICSLWSYLNILNSIPQLQNENNKYIY